MGQGERNAHGVRYRADIDGLRAIAVLSVLAEHLRTRISGGYVGVDVFFVISGYLISTVILADLQRDRFSMVTFYERRIRRIFPAMLVMMLVTTLLVYRLFVPAEVMTYARSLLAALFSVSNLLFWHESGYFAAASWLKPLLHTWSLAVEEQFYLIFPPFLLFARRYSPQRLRALLLGLAGLSFVAALLTVRHHTDAAFFFAPLRAWELLIGTIVSQRYFAAPKTALARNLCSALGLLLILVPCVLYTAGTLFPGLAALPPCLGAALIIAGGETGPSVVGSVLSFQPLRWIGLISYSLYLWHWPILVFQDTSSLLTSAPSSAASTKLLVAAVSIVVAALSWALVEQPFRTGRFRPGKRAVFLINGVGAALVALLAGGLLLSHGAPSRFPPEALAVARYMDYDPGPHYRADSCFLTNGQPLSDFKPEPCLALTPGRPSMLLLGDSHAAQLWPGLAARFPGDSLLQANVSACRPYLVDDAPDGCSQFFRKLWMEFLARHHVDTVILAGRWQSDEFPRMEHTLAFAREHGIHVVLVGPNIEYDTPLPRVLATAMRDHDLGRVEAHRSMAPQELDREMERLAQTQWHVPYVSVYRALCTPRCPVYAAPGVPLLFDTDHLTAEGSVDLLRAIANSGQLP